MMLVSSGRRLLPERSRRSATAAFVSSRDSEPRSHLRHIVCVTANTDAGCVRQWLKPSAIANNSIGRVAQHAGCNLSGAKINR